jgi:hypothetical protein
MSSAVLVDGPYTVVWQAVACCERGERAVPGAARESAKRADPQRTRAVFVDRPDAIVGQTVARRVGAELAAVERPESRSRAHPDRAVAVLANARYAFIRQCWTGGRVELLVLEAREPGGGANPQLALSVFEENLYLVAGDFGRILGIEDLETHSVEANESFLGRQPDIAVLSLENGANSIVWQPLISLPDIAPELVQ